LDLPVKEAVEKALRRIEPILYNLIKESWKDWRTGQWTPTFRFGRTRANILWEFIIKRADEAFANDPGIERKEKHQTVSYIIDETVLFRFKKGDRQGYTCNVPTQRALAFDNHNINDIDQRKMFQALLFQDAYPSRVEIVYTLNKLSTDIENIFVVARNKGKKLWAYPVAPSQAVIQEFPAFPTPKTPPSSIVVPKIPETEVNTEGGDIEH